MAASETLFPQEQLQSTLRTLKQFSIGLPTEISPDENRIALVPSAVSLLVQNGHRIIVQRNAGIPAHFSNTDYADAGAEIVDSAEEVFKADIILKVAPLRENELEFLRPRQIIISAIQAVNQNKEYFKKLLAKKMNALAFELIKDNSNAYPVLRATSEIAGTTSILIAAEYLSHSELGRGSMLGGFPGINPSEVVILGAGTVGEYAARTALGMGALVKVFDDKIYKLRALQQNLGQRLFTSIMQPEVLYKSLRTADVAIGAMHTHEGRTPLFVSETIVSQMKKGAVIIDVSIDQGGCFETSRPTSHSNPVFQTFGVTHYCVPNIASKVPHTASYALSNVFTPILLQIGFAGGLETYLRQEPGVRQGVYILNGTLTSKFIGDFFQIPSQDIELLMAAFH